MNQKSNVTQKIALGITIGCAILLFILIFFVFGGIISFHFTSSKTEQVTHQPKFEIIEDSKHSANETPTTNQTKGTVTENHIISFSSKIRKEDITSIEDYTPNMLLDSDIFFEGVFYGSNIEDKRLIKTMKSFNGAEFNNGLVIKEDTDLDLSIITDMTEDMFGVFIISEDKVYSIPLTASNYKLTLEKGTYKLGLVGYLAKGNVEFIINNSEHLSWVVLEN